LYTPEYAYKKETGNRFLGVVIPSNFRTKKEEEKRIFRESDGIMWIPMAHKVGFRVGNSVGSVVGACFFPQSLM